MFRYIRLYTALLISICVSHTFQSIPMQNLKKSNFNKNILNNTEPKENRAPFVNIQLPSINETEKKVKESNRSQNQAVFPNLEDKNNSHVNKIEPGADLRLVSVISLIVLSCLLCICCRIYRNRKIPKVIKKYGERRHRTDVEMAPLPLHEEEDDETIFDLGNINSRTIH